MNPLRHGLVPVIGALLLSACATASRPPTGAAALPSPPGKDDCLWIRTLDDWSPIDRERLILWGPGAGKNRATYLATLAIPSPDLDFNFSIGFLDRDNDSRLCAFDDIILRTGSGIPDRIMIRSLQRIEPADARMLLDAARPKRAKKHKVDHSAAPAVETAPPAGSVAPQGR